MTPNSPLTYEDFISQVEGAMLPDSPLRVASEGNSLLFSGADKANSDFKFEDMEVGKIYVIWAPNAETSGNQLWFLTPHTLHNEHDYSVYWCYYLNPIGRMQKPILSGYKCSSWSGYVWGGGKRWKVLEHNLFNAFMNWINENPFEVKS